MKMQPTKLIPNYTGEGFSGERFLAITAVCLTIVSTIMLIQLTKRQREHTEMELEKLNREREREKK